MTDNSRKINLNYLLSKIVSSSFRNYGYYNQAFLLDNRYAHHFPVFNFVTIETMRRDPRIQFGLNLIKGPIASYTRFFSEVEADQPGLHKAIIEMDYHFPYVVKCDNEKQQEYILRQFKRFWEVGIFKAMEAIDWGFSGSEVLYRKSKNYAIEFDNLELFHPRDLQAMSERDAFIGFIRNNDRARFVPVGKGFWHVHKRQIHKYYGESRLRGAHIPWHETWMLGGARDIRRTWFFRYAYDGGQIYYPEGSFQDETGTVVQNEALAMQMAEMKRTGSTIAFPSTKGIDGKREWEFEPPHTGVTPMGLHEFIQLLRDEELEGLGIPPEVIQSGSGNGLGSATGRMIPQQAFIAALTPIVSDLINDFKTQILDTLLLMNGMTEEFSIERIVPTKLDEPATRPEMKTESTGLNI
jgi:hypothetical protein